MSLRRVVAHALVMVAVGCSGRSEPPVRTPDGPAPSPEASAPPVASAQASRAAEPPLPPGVAWPTPEGWRREVIPFPLEFAPSVAARGVEEIRFAPDFFRSEAPTFWSYAFVWLLDDPPAVDAAWLEHALIVYFSGLADAVGGEKYHFDRARYRATLRPAAAASSGWRAWQGTFDGYEPFVTGHPMTLHLLALVGDCGARRGILVAASPQPPDHEVWTRLNERLAAFHCN